MAVRRVGGICLRSALKGVPNCRCISTEPRGHPAAALGGHKFSAYNSKLQDAVRWCSSVGSESREGFGEWAKSPQGATQTSADEGRSVASTTEEGHMEEGHSDSEVSAAGPISMTMAVDKGFKPSPRHDLAMLFTCTVCDVRSAKTMSRATYETGVVIVRCPGCQNLHLIADRYGWFGNPGSVEDFLAEKGVDVKKGSESSYEFTVEDMTGWTPKVGNSDK